MFSFKLCFIFLSILLVFLQFLLYWQDSVCWHNILIRFERADFILMFFCFFFLKWEQDYKRVEVTFLWGWREKSLNMVKTWQSIRLTADQNKKITWPQRSKFPPKVGGTSVLFSLYKKGPWGSIEKMWLLLDKKNLPNLLQFFPHHHQVLSCISLLVNLHPQAVVLIQENSPSLQPTLFLLHNFSKMYFSIIQIPDFQCKRIALIL